MSTTAAGLDNEARGSKIDSSTFIERAQCGKLGFSIVTVNMVAGAVFLGNLALGGALVGALSLAVSAIALPSMALFGVSNYFYYLPRPLLMGLGFAIAWASVKVDADGVWKGRFADWAHFDDPRLAEGLVSFFKENNIQTALDCGCGTGFYVKHLQANGFKDVYGCDGNPDTPALGGTNCFEANLANPNFLEGTICSGKKFPCVTCFEVAEHLPKAFEDAFLKNITEAVDEKGCLVISWAKVGQGGLGHVNEQNEEYVLAKMKELGFEIDWPATLKLRLNTSPHTFWFSETIYVFRRSVKSD